jgi:outer membrane receptor protein involved in Fe transport
VNQAPLTFNASLDYSDQGTNARVSFNVVARRLVEVGTYGLPDGYLQPRPSLDATVGQEFAKHWQVKLNAENLLNAPYVVTQGPDLEANDRNVQMKYRTGRIFSIAARYEY